MYVSHQERDNIALTGYDHGAAPGPWHRLRNVFSIIHSRVSWLTETPMICSNPLSDTVKLAALISCDIRNFHRGKPPSPKSCLITLALTRSVHELFPKHHLAVTKNLVQTHRRERSPGSRYFPAVLCTL